MARHTRIDAVEMDRVKRVIIEMIRPRPQPHQLGQILDHGWIAMGKPLSQAIRQGEIAVPQKNGGPLGTSQGAKRFVAPARTRRRRAPARDPSAMGILWLIRVVATAAVVGKAYSDRPVSMLLPWRYSYFVPAVGATPVETLSTDSLRDESGPAPLPCAMPSASSSIAFHLLHLADRDLLAGWLAAPHARRW
jgi:hypothetical protein